jgi:hypothetical protein
MGIKRKLLDGELPTLGGLIAELCETPKGLRPEGQRPKVAVPSTTTRPVRARRAGPFKVPASMAGPGNPEREELARRFKQHLRGVSGANKLGADPDEYVPPVRPGSQRSVRPGGFRPGMPSRFGRPSVLSSNDEDDE